MKGKVCEGDSFAFRPKVEEFQESLLLPYTFKSKGRTEAAFREGLLIWTYKKLYFQMILLILAKCLTKSSPKMQNLGQSSGPTGFFFFFFLLPALNLLPKVFIKLYDSNFKNTNFSSLGGGPHPPQTTPVRPSMYLMWCPSPPNHHKKC